MFKIKKANGACKALGFNIVLHKANNFSVLLIAANIVKWLQFDMFQR